MINGCLSVPRHVKKQAKELREEELRGMEEKEAVAAPDLATKEGGEEGDLPRDASGDTAGRSSVLSTGRDRFDSQLALALKMDTDEAEL